MPTRWPVWKQAGVSGLMLSTLWFVAGPALSVPWSARLIVSVCLGAFYSAAMAVGLAVGQRRAFGDRLTATQRAQVEEIVRGRATSDDPRLWRAAFCLAREWTSWRNSRVLPAVIIGVFLVWVVGAAVELAPQFWVWAAVLGLAGPWAIWLVARNRAAAARFLATATPPAPAATWVPWA